MRPTIEIPPKTKVRRNRKLLSAEELHALSHHEDPDEMRAIDVFYGILIGLGLALMGWVGWDLWVSR